METNSKPQGFGELLRHLRRQADKTLGDVAKLLGVSVVYLSDVERGNRNPFSRGRILRIADFLNNADPAQLLEAADRERGFIEYDITDATPLQAEVVGGLVTGLARGGISEDQLHKIQDVLRERQEDK